MLPPRFLQEGGKLRLAGVLVALHGIMLQGGSVESPGLMGREIIHRSHAQDGHGRGHPAEPHRGLVHAEVHIHRVHQHKLLIPVHMHLHADPEVGVGLLDLHPGVHHHGIPPADLRHLPRRPDLVNEPQHTLRVVHHVGPLPVPFDQGLRGVRGGLDDGLGLPLHPAGVRQVRLRFRQKLLSRPVDSHHRHDGARVILVRVVDLLLLLRDIQELGGRGVPVVIDMNRGSLGLVASLRAAQLQQLKLLVPGADGLHGVQGARLRCGRRNNKQAESHNL
mmetsp:Transcript_41312/g.108495  ORF Transcript_41312/g.108495 Transcript_41312/m.108495 type:complete len:277 (-) Transcript_41312:112-942(-)